MAIVEELKKIGGGTGSTIEEAIASGDFSGGAFYFVVTGAIDALTSSATFKELRAAILAHKVVFCDHANKILYLSYFGLPNSLEFSNVVYRNSQVILYKIKITKRDEVTLETVNLTTAS